MVKKIFPSVDGGLTCSGCAGCTESLTTSILYGDVNEDAADVDYKDDKYVLASVEYTF